MAEDINYSGKDTSKVLSDGVRTHYNTQNTVLSSVDNIQKWYAQQQAELFETTETSRLSTSTETPDIEGLATAEENTDGLQTSVEDIESNLKLMMKLLQVSYKLKLKKTNKKNLLSVGYQQKLMKTIILTMIM